MTRSRRERRRPTRVLTVVVLLLAGAALLCRRTVVRAAERPAVRVPLVGDSKLARPARRP